MFSKFTKWSSKIAGSPASLVFAILLVVIWLLTGRYYKYSDTWQLVINTATNAITFIMVFIIQNSQNRETLAMQVKLDELIRSSKGAHNKIIAIEDLTDEEIKALNERYENLCQAIKKKTNESDTDVPEV